MNTVVITGANRGIGLELCRLYLAAGWRVFAGARAPDEATALRAMAGQLSVLRLDVENATDVAEFQTALTGVAVDVLINNAGVMGGDQQSLEDMDYAAWEQAFRVNTLAPFRLIAALQPNLMKAQKPRAITLSSQMGSLERKSRGSHAYRSSKAAVNKVMQVLALELEAAGIIVCPVHPGWVRTDMGGGNADISVEESSAGLFQLIDSLTPAHSGRFWTWNGEEHPW